MTPKPYVGITGPATIGEIDGVLSEFQSAGFGMDSHHIPMIGVLASYKTLMGQATTNRRYPAVERIPGIVAQGAGKCFTTIHYNTRDQYSLAEQFRRVIKEVYDAGTCKGMQLNIVWPDASAVGKLKEEFPDLQIIFQASRHVLEGKTPTEVAEGIKAYGEAISYVLIDPSGGRGIPFDVEHSIALYAAVREHIPHVSVGFAGGFTGENVARIVGDLTTRLGTNEFCIDAEGGLRDPVSPAYGDDLLNMEKVRAYIAGASAGMK